YDIKILYISTYIFFFSSRRRHTRFSRDWSSDVCSSDLAGPRPAHPTPRPAGGSPMRQFTAVVNPTAGGSTGAAALITLARLLREAGADPRTEDRRSLAHAGEPARPARGPGPGGPALRGG